MKDSRGNRSKTLPFVVVAFIAVTARFLAGGLTLGQFGEVPAMDGWSYGAAIGAILAIWLGREWKQKNLESRHD